MNFRIFVARIAWAGLIAAVALVALTLALPGCSTNAPSPGSVASGPALDPQMSAAAEWADLAVESAQAAKEILFAVDPARAADWSAHLNAAELLAREVISTAASAPPQALRDKRWWVISILREALILAPAVLQAARG